MMDFKTIDFQTQGCVARIDMKFAPSNILSFEMMAELRQAVEMAESSPILALRSSLKNFSLGVDIKIHTPPQIPEMLSSFHDLIRRIYHFPGVTVCFVQGYALGGGLELAIVCDFLFAAKNANLGFPEIRLACFPPVAAALLPEMIGRRANTLLLLGDTISGEQAGVAGMVDGLFDAGEAETFQDQFLKKISAYSGDALGTLKRLLNQTAGADFDRRLEMAERVYIDELLKSPDVAEGINAFLEKRVPRYRNA